MVVEIITFLIYILLVAAGFWLVVWVLRKAGIEIPQMVLQIAGAILFLLVLLWAVQRWGGVLP